MQNFNRNVIINGDFDIWQRGTSFTAPNDVYTADRWNYNNAGTGVVDVLRSTDVPTQAQSGHKSNYSLHVDVTTLDAVIAVDAIYEVRQMIEGYNYKQFEGNTGTLSFWVKGTKTGIHSVSFVSAGFDRSYVVEYTINVTDTWEFKTIVVTFDYSGGTWDYINGIGLHINWQLATGSNFQGVADTWNSANDRGTSNQVNAMDSTSNNFRLSQISFKLGSNATVFQRAGATIGDEQAMAQRYAFEAIDGTDATAGNGYSINTTQSQITIKFPVTMRTTPSFSTAFGTIGDIDIFQQGSTFVVSAFVSAGFESPDTFTIRTTCASMTADLGVTLVGGTGDPSLFFDAEL